MKNILKKYLYLSSLLALSIVIGSCSDDDNFGSDASKVIPIVKELNGETVVFEGNIVTYTVKPYRGGSEYIWNAPGAVLQPVEGRKDQVNVLFNQAQPVTLSVYETAFNGKSSDPISVEITVFGTPCDWTIDMQDAYGDGWNGASLSFAFDGIDGGEYTIADGASSSEVIAVPNGSVVDVTFNSGAWDEEVTFQIYDGNGTLVLDAGPTPTVGSVLSMTNSCP